MPSADENRFWYVRARFRDSHNGRGDWSHSGLMTWSQARRMFEAVTAVGMEAEICEWMPCRRARAA